MSNMHVTLRWKGKQKKQEERMPKSSIQKEVIKHKPKENIIDIKQLTTQR